MAERNWDAARVRFEEALSLARNIGDRQGEASHLGNLGHILLEQLQKDKAARHFQMALKLAREIGDAQIEGRVSASLGLLRLTSRTRDAILESTSDFNAALGIARQIGDRRGEASHLGCLGLAHELLSGGLSLSAFVTGPDPGPDDERRRRYSRELERADQDNLWRPSDTTGALAESRTRLVTGRRKRNSARTRNGWTPHSVSGISYRPRNRPTSGPDGVRSVVTRLQ